jgi:tetratricopeptide (TPR) repeat protein
LGLVHAAEISNRKAMALFESVAKANPNNVTDQLNLAMAYRWRAFVDVYETTGRAEIDRALAVTEPLIRTNANNLDLKKELAEEYMIRADIQDAVGDRLDAIDSYRKVRDLRQELLNTHPADTSARRALAKVTVILAHEMGRFGSPDEAIRLMNVGIADFQALAKETGDPGLIREVAAADSRRGDVELLRGDLAAARKDFQTSLRRFEPLAKLDPENKMLQSDVWVGRFEYGRALAVGGRYAEALPLMKDALRGYQSLHLEADVGVSPPAMQAWIAEAQAGTHDFRGALKSLETSAAGLAEDQGNFDDARCDLAMVDTKIGNVLLKMINPAQAKEHYEKALATAKLPESIRHNDFPSLYAAAEAHAGLGDIAVSQSLAANNAATRQKLLDDACASYHSTLDLWKRIPHQSRYTGNGYLSRDPDTLKQQMAICKTN